MEEIKHKILHQKKQSSRNGRSFKHKNGDKGNAAENCGKKNAGTRHKKRKEGEIGCIEKRKRNTGKECGCGET